MNILLKSDKRLFSYQRNFGETTNIQPTLLLDSGDLPIEPVGSVQCTTYTTTSIGKDETGKDYSIDEVWQAMITEGKVSNGGALPQDAFSAFVGLESNDFTSYYQTDIGIYDRFGNVQSAIQLEFNAGRKRTQGCGTYWYPNWNEVPQNGILPMGQGTPSKHEWKVCGWDAEHGNAFKINAWEGYYVWIPQEVFNGTMNATYGSVALTLATSSQETIDFNKAIKISTLQKLIQLYENVIILLTELKNTLYGKLFN